MNTFTFFTFIISILLAFLCNISIDGSVYYGISFFLLFFYTINFIHSLGTQININQITILFGVLQLLLMPIVVYRIYNEDKNVIALLYNMNLDEKEYFSFVVPALIAMIIGLQIPLLSNYFKKEILQQSIYKIKMYLIGKSNIGLYLMIIGLSSGFFTPFLPSTLGYLSYLFSKLLYVGILYIYFSDNKNKNYFLLGGIAGLLVNTIVQGMFGELIFTSILALLLIFLTQKISSVKKITVCIVGFFLIIVLQTIKSDYRKATWFGQKDANVSNTEIFFSLIINKISNPSSFFNKEDIFPTIVRFNQGMIQDKVMDYVPRIRPFAEGKTIYTSLAASLIPRFFWPDKPMSGGKWNMEYFTGLIIEGYSMNIGPLGEAYGNFGPKGGIYFMFFYGLFFNLALFILFQICKNRPTILLWFPILFLNSIQVETDILMTVNSLIKNSLFVAFCYWASERFLRIRL